MGGAVVHSDLHFLFVCINRGLKCNCCLIVDMSQSFLECANLCGSSCAGCGEIGVLRCALVISFLCGCGQ